jgi:hypothetical protein
MAKNRQNQSSAIRFGPALKASFLCLLIGGSAVGYVWQKNEIYRLGQQIQRRETCLTLLSRDNQRQRDQLAILHSPVMLDQRARELKLGLVPAQPAQIVRLGEAVEVTGDKIQSRQFAERPVVVVTQ